MDDLPPALPSTLVSFFRKVNIRERLEQRATITKTRISKVQIANYNDTVEKEITELTSSLSTEIIAAVKINAGDSQRTIEEKVSMANQFMSKIRSLTSWFKEKAAMIIKQIGKGLAWIGKKVGELINNILSVF